MNLSIPQNAIVVMVGAIATGKSTLTSKHFSPHHIVETDFIREQLSGDPEDQTYNKATFELLYATVDIRLKYNVFTVVDSTGSNAMLERVRQIAKDHGKEMVVLKMPHLSPEEINKERFGKRWYYRDVYYTQVARIDKTRFAKDVTVHEIEDINNLSITLEDAHQANTLDPAFEYVVVPDLHGEYEVLETIIDTFGEDNTKKFVFLGDIVDRGKSSHKTFRLVDTLIREGRGFGVISNHDNKLMRWFKKWQKDIDVDKYSNTDYLTYGMKVAHGLSNTLSEFQSMDKEDMDKYAYDFVKYYERANPYLRVERDDGTHYFSHAGISIDILRGMPVTKRDVSVLLYETLKGEDLDERNHLEGKNKNIIHLGHDSVDDAPKIVFKDDSTVVWKHDFGLGKVSLDVIPEFEIV